MKNTDIEKKIADGMLEVLMDVNTENKKIIKRQTGVIVFLISLLFISFCYYQWNFQAFLSQYDYTNTITETNTTNDNKAYQANSPINATIKDIKVNSEK